MRECNVNLGRGLVLTECCITKIANLNSHKLVKEKRFFLFIMLWDVVYIQRVYDDTCWTVNR